MSIYYTGQRVRVRPSLSNWPELIGLEGTVVGPLREWSDMTGQGYPVVLDGLPPLEAGRGSLIVVNSFGDTCNFTPEGRHLEPILRKDNEVGDWAELGFHPSQFNRVQA